MSGTRWTEPGQGALLTELWHSAVMADDSAIALRRIKRISAFWIAHRCVQVNRLGRPELAIYKTNLKLTGEPLTPQDIRNIAEAK